MKGSWLVAGIGILVAAFRVNAEPIPPERIPDALRPWVGWVLHGEEARLCPFLHSADARQCVWPSRLVLALDDRRGHFTQDWLIHDRAWVRLPGDERHWPQDVEVDDRPTPVALRDGAPAVLLEKGSHRVSGSFQWDSLPELLSVPPETGLVSLSLRGREVPFPNREPQGQLWLQKRTEGTEESRLDVIVYRMVTDEIPLLLRTRLELRVAGKSREVLLGTSLPEGFAPMSLDGPLPARVEPDGRLRVQVRPGAWMIDLVARHEGPASELELAANEGPWDDEEVWVFDARPDLRLASIEGVPAIDPQQTELPGDWRSFPAFLMKPGSVMKIVEKRRGDSEPAPDQLALRRMWWLDFDGGGFTIQDQISGTTSRSWRLEMAPPTTLGRVSIDGRDQFITRLGDRPSAGVEIRQGSLRVEADSRFEGAVARMPAVGWSHDFRQVGGELRLPPGWRLFHASGVDDVSSSWIADWTLLDLFLVLVIAMATGRLCGWTWGAISLLTLALTWPEPGAPGVAWLFVLAGLALVRALPEGRFLRFARLYYLAAAVALLLVAIPFSIAQVRQGIWPALERPWAGVPQAAGVAGGALRAAGRLADEATELGASIEERGREVLEYDRLSAKPAAPAHRKEAYLRQIDPNALITTGPGLPRWAWTSVSLGWRGPVEQGEEVSLVLISPRLNLLLALLRVALLAALVAGVCALLGKTWRAIVMPAAATTAVILAVALFAPTPAGAADIPSKELLDELRNRLLENPDCFPACASIPRLNLEATGAALSIRLEVDAASGTAIPLPGNRQSWSPRNVALDGRPAPGLMRSAEGTLWLEIPTGRHQVILEGPLPATDTVEIPLPLRPHRAEATAAGWTVVGLTEDGLVGENLQLVRTERDPAKDGEMLRPGVLPPFVRVERTLRLGLSLEVDTRITRLTPTGSAVVLEVPLLEGESVTTPDVRVENGKAFVSFGPQASLAGWHSILAEGARLELSAPQPVPWTEVWRLEASPIWHVEVEGIPVVHRQAGGDTRTREWHPWPGEKVAIALARPAGVPGPTLTIDHSSLETTPGLRATDVKLTLEIRSSRGAQHAITLPEGAELLSVAINGSTQPIRQENRTVTLPIVPGLQTVVIDWREPRGIGARFATSEVSAGRAGVNVDLRVAVPMDRWILFLGGPRLGPAVLFWSVLVVLLLLAAALGRVRLTPLRAHAWFLLGIGFTQVDVTVAAVVAGWLLLLGWRRERGAAMTDVRFDLVQLLLAAWTLVAFGALVASIQQGLLGLPDMHVAGNGSSAYDLRWYQDRAGVALPQAWVISAPLFAYRLVMLSWALWLAFAWLRWVRWGWSCFSEGGLWRAVPWRIPRRNPRSPAVS